MSTTVSPPPPAAEEIDVLREQLISAVREADWKRLYEMSAAIAPAEPPAIGDGADASTTVGYSNGHPVSVADVMARSDSADRAIAEGRTYTADEILAEHAEWVREHTA